jgi:mannose-6-phosphate isomerase-like protein (cupin superfamily)
VVTGQPIFPGGTAVSGLSVYPWAAGDGVCGGSPHVHLACTEAYVVVGGRGAVQTLTAEGPRETPLRAGSVVWFGPGTVHRAVNHDGALRVVVVMQNSGLPESGDAVLTFPPDVLADREAYRRAAALDAPGAAHAADETAARRRRDLAVRGFLRLVEEVKGGNVAALEDFYRRAVALVADRVAGWPDIVAHGPGEAVRRTEEHLAALRDGRIDHLLDAAVRAESAPAPDGRRLGMCGHLDTYHLT